MITRSTILTSLVAAVSIVSGLSLLPVFWRHHRLISGYVVGAIVILCLALGISFIHRLTLSHSKNQALEPLSGGHWLPPNPLRFLTGYVFTSIGLALLWSAFIVLILNREIRDHLTLPGVLCTAIGVLFLLAEHLRYWWLHLLAFLKTMNPSHPGFEAQLIIVIRVIGCLGIVALIALRLTRQMFHDDYATEFFRANSLQTSYIVWTVFAGTLVMSLIVAIRPLTFRVLAATVLFGVLGYIVMFYVLFYTAIPLVKVSSTAFGFDHLRILKASARSGIFDGLSLSLVAVCLTAGFRFIYDKVVRTNQQHELLMALGSTGVLLLGSFIFLDQVMSALMLPLLIVVGGLTLILSFIGLA